MKKTAISLVSIWCERARLAGSTRQAVALMADKIIGRVLAADIIDAGTGEVILPEGHVLTTDDMDELDKKLKLSLHGSQLDINDDMNHTNVIENVYLGAPEESIRASCARL